MLTPWSLRLFEFVTFCLPFPNLPFNRISQNDNNKWLVVLNLVPVCNQWPALRGPLLKPSSWKHMTGIIGCRVNAYQMRGGSFQFVFSQHRYRCLTFLLKVTFHLWPRGCLHYTAPLYEVSSPHYGSPWRVGLFPSHTHGDTWLLRFPLLSCS